MAALGLTVLRILLSFGNLATATSPSKTALDCWCFGCGSGVSRLDAGVAVQDACNYWSTTVMTPDSPTDGGLGFNYGWSGGNVMMSVVPFWNEMGCGEEPNNFFAYFLRCYYSFMAPVDNCNTNGVNHKQGGYYYEYCANVTINPNPDGCDASARFVENFKAMPNTGTVDHYASDVEHAAAKAKLRAASWFMDDGNASTTGETNAAVTTGR